MVQKYEPLNATGYYIGKNVTVSPDVVIAAGAVLDAAPGSQLMIESGVCIGSGTVIQVYGGDLTLASGVSLGKAVLLVGTGHIGTHACIGAESTLINPQVEADAVVPARSLIGPNGTAQGLEASPSTNGHGRPATEPNGQGGVATPPSATNGNGSGAPAPHEEQEGTLTSAKIVYGRDQVMQLVKTLFPHRDLLNSGDSS